MSIVSVVSDRFRALKYVFSVKAQSRYDNMQSPVVKMAAETFRQIKRDDVTLMAAGVSYYAIVSLFPLTLVLLWVLNLFSDSETARANLEDFFSVYLPDSVGFVDQISGQDSTTSGLLGIVGFVGLIWGGTAMLSALSRAINRAYGVESTRPFYKERPLTILLGLGVIFSFIISLVGSAAIESVSQFDVPILGELAWVQVFARLFPFLVTFTTFALVYKLLPAVDTTWNNVIPAALLVAVLFEAAKVLFLIYVNRFASFEVYGGMSLIIVLLVWSYFSALVVLIGAELVSVRRLMQRGEL